MMFRRRSPFGLFILVGLGVLLGAAIFGTSETVGGLVAAPLLVVGVVFKIFLFFLLFGLAARLFAGAGHRGRQAKSWPGRSHPWWSEDARNRWHGRGESSENDEASQRDDRFDEWHRLAHARQEVDDHTPPVEQ